MYNKLLISAGGGIISRNQQSEQAEAATIAIGLGGTGISCLRELKKEVYNKLKPDADNSDIPNYKHIKFLALDTDAGSLGDTGSIDTIDSNTEFFNISCPDITGLLDRITTLKNEPHLKWLKTADPKSGISGLSILNASAGAGGVRQIGRLLLLQSSRAFTQKLEQIITAARAGLPGDVPLNIHIFTGLGGGTGAGTFMDVCYLVQYVLKKAGLYGQAQTCGFFFLPDVNVSKAPSTEVKEYVKINGFAAMKELDYAMNYSSNGGEWNQIYDGFTIISSDAPVKLAHLITATAADGAIRDNGYDYAMRVVVDYVLEFMTKPYIPEGKNANDGIFTIESHIANIKRCMEMVPKKYGACYDYCVLGASNTYLPYKEITTYLASKIFESFNYLNKNIPNENDLDLFIHSNGLKYEDISRELNSQLPTVPNFAVDTKTLQEQCEGITPDTIPQVLSQMRDSIPKIAGVLETNKKNLTNGAENTLVENAKSISSLISRVKKSLIQITSDPAKGPYYAAAFLHSNATKDLQNKVDGYIKTNSDALAYARADLGLRDQAVANTLREFQNSKKLNRKSKGEAYVSAVHGYFLAVTKIDNLIALGELLKEFKKQLEDLYNGFFKIFTTVLDNLISTFNANLTALAEPITTVEAYSKPLMTILDLKESLDTSVSKMRITDMVNHFIDALMNDEKTWISQDENKISASVTKFFLSELDAFTNKTIVDYLQIRFKTTNPILLKNKIYDEIMIPAHKDASPLFWTDASKYSISDACKIGYCSVPEISPEIQAASDDLHMLDDKITKRVVKSTDRISIFEFLCGVPMFGYKGVSNYFGEYNAKKMTGAHLYENTPEDDRDFRKLPNIAPFSSITVERTQTQLSNSDEYDFAFDNSIITVNGEIDEYRIGIFDLNHYNNLINQINQVVATKNPVAINNLLNELPSMPIVSDTRVITSNGSTGYKETVVKDNALASLYIMDIIKEQNNVLREYNAAKEKLNEMLNEIGTGDKISSDFVEALCAGIIKRDEQNIFLYTYQKNTFGIVEDAELTNITTLPYGKQMPLYSAFVEYKKLDNDIRNDISRLVQEKMTQDYNFIVENTAKIKELVAVESKKVVNMAHTNFVLEADEIISVIGKINKQLSVI